MSKQQTRARLRDQRRRLSPYRQKRASEALGRRLRGQLFFARARHIAFYLPNDGEIDPTPLMLKALAMRKIAYLPVLDPQRPGQLAFMPWKPGLPLTKNRYRIPEPPYRPGARPKPWLLDIVFMPLVAFDRQGNRLGMGGGFYDRTFASRSSRPQARPLLVGLAHDFQQLDELPADPWDVPLQAVATDRRLLYLHPRLRTPGP